MNLARPARRFDAAPPPWRTAIALAVLGLVGPLLPAAAAEDPRQIEFFESRIRPLFVKHCHECHGQGKTKGGLSLESAAGLLKGGDRGLAIVLGRPSESLLIDAVGWSGELKMPPAGMLSDQERSDLASWIESGVAWPDESGSLPIRQPEKTITAADRDFWCFQPVQAPAIPTVQNASWPKGAIDAFILAELERQGLKPAPPAGRRALIRRATFDLIGLPPTPEEVEAFVNDTADDALAKVVDRLLASPHYGERWGRHWLDVARYAEDQAHTFDAKQYTSGYRYRDWVVRALNDDLPYDRFVMEQIAGDLLEGGREHDRLIALGFFALGPIYYKDAGCAEKAALDELDDRVDTLSRGFLGLTVACARCHDHKFDPITQHDYYALAGVFSSTAFRDAPIVPPEVVAAYDQGQAAIRRHDELIAKFVAAEMALASDPAAAALVEVARQRLVALRAELEVLKKSAPAMYDHAHSLAEGTAADMPLHVRGDPTRTADGVPRRFLSVLSSDPPPPFTQGSGRLELAKAIASPANPLTSRVIVNRVWQWHFGRGIVGTASNFGMQGERPSHPALLDYLAHRLIELNWSLKALHREIMLSAVYQSSSEHNARAAELDPQNRLLWRMPRRRLEVEAWRDALLAVAGNLDRSIGGPATDLAGADNHRRTMYGGVSRHNLDSLLRLFDFPDPNITSSERTLTTVPLQQLFVLNSDFMTQQAKALAARLEQEAGADDAGRIRLAFPLLYGRPPTDEELSLGLEFLSVAAVTSGAEGALSPWEQYAQALLGANEFAFVD